MTHDELESYVTRELAQPRFRVDQIFKWIHALGAGSFPAMTNLPETLRERLTAEATLTSVAVLEIRTASDGTRKLLFGARDGAVVESVLIPDGEKLTLCVSSQVGCALDCHFCATAKLGFTRNLTAQEIIGQVYAAKALVKGQRITNLVYMGMGEPLHNYEEVMRSLRILVDDRGADFSKRRITVSTAGLVPAIERLGKESIEVNLAVSLNATTDEVRSQLMPINRKWGLCALLAAIREFPLARRRRITFEYVLLAGINDSPDDVHRLADLLKGIPSKLNLIPWNPHPNAPYRRPEPHVIARFQEEAKRSGLPTYLRLPRGDDIDAACGQLAANAREKI